MEDNKSSLMPKRHIAIAEAGRGFAAFYVFVFHIIKFTDIKDVLPKETIQYYIVKTLGTYGHEAVLFFFLLSGFSIHYSSLDRPLNNLQGVIRYFYLRFRRIYPIYLLAVILTLLLLYVGYYLYPAQFNHEYKELNAKIIFLNLIFLADRYYKDGILSRTIPINGPLWSLSYEVLYYLIYPLYWLFNKRYGQAATMIICAIISIIAITYSKIIGSNHFTNVLSLYVIWALGACVAQIFRTGILEKKYKWHYILFIIYLLSQSVWVLENATYTLGAYYEIIWGLLFFLTMLYFIVASENKIGKAEKIILALLFILGAVFIDVVSYLIKLTKDITYFYIKIHITLIIFLIIGLINKCNLRVVVRLILIPFEKIGAYSYALYIIHYPILFLFYELLKSYGYHSLIILCIIPVIMMLAKIIEGDYQIYMKKNLDRVLLGK